MIVCVCRAVSDRVIRATISKGATTVAEVGMACRAGTCCGACRPTINRLLEEAQPQRAEPLHPSLQPSAMTDREARSAAIADPARIAA